MKVFAAIVLILIGIESAAIIAIFAGFGVAERTTDGGRADLGSVKRLEESTYRLAKACWGVGYQSGRLAETVALADAEGVKVDAKTRKMLSNGVAPKECAE